MQDLPKAIVIVGPTASGKSDIAIHLAKELDGEIIAADSRTIYREMNIGTAKPERDNDQNTDHESISDLFGGKKYMVEDIAHWGFDLVGPNESYDVQSFADYAREKIKDILEKGKMPVIVGGSGFYIKSIVDNPVYPKDSVDKNLREQLSSMTLEELQVYLKNIDPEGFESIDIQNPVRMKRAIEIIETTGKPWSEQEVETDPYLDVMQIGIEREREELYERINARVDKMVAEGLVDEVRGLVEKYGKDAPAMTGIGYRQIVEFLEGRLSLKEAIGNLKRDTRHLAKRQLTWFKRDERIHWEDQYEEILAKIKSFLKS